MDGRKNAEKELRWREMLKRHADSGVSVREFCTSEGVSEPSFYAWRKRLRESIGDGRRMRGPRRGEEASNDDRLFVPLELVGSPATLEIVHPLGYRVQVGGEVNPDTLRQVIEVLDQRGAR